MKKTIQAHDNYWTNPKFVIKCVGPKLVPFFKTIVLYLVLADRESPSWLTLVLKCLPITWLCIFVVLHGISLGEEHVYSRRILFGLVFSCVGDALLVWPCVSCFLWGMLSFGIAHIFYITAFGFHPLNPLVGGVVASLGAVVYYLMYPNLEGTIFSVAVPIYNCVLILMVWRAVARVQFFEDLWTWTKLCSCFGGILFAISDTILGLREFGIATNIIDTKYLHLLVMLTYYSAQVGIALSVVDSKAMAILSVAYEAERLRDDNKKEEIKSLKSVSRKLKANYKNQTNKS